MPSLKRFPFALTEILGEYLAEKPGLILTIERTNDFSYSIFHAPLGLPVDIAYFIHMHTVCAYCGNSIARELNSCTCKRAINEPNLLRVFCSEEADNKYLKVLLQRETGRASAWRRKERMKKSGGSHSQEEIETLFGLQQGFCYFCGKELVNNSGNTEFDKDHYIPIIKGGSDNIENIVLTCPTCNRSKLMQSGDTYEYKIKKQRTKEINRFLGNIRRGREKYLLSRNLVSTVDI